MLTVGLGGNGTLLYRQYRTGAVRNVHEYVKILSDRFTNERLLSDRHMIKSDVWLLHEHEHYTEDVKEDSFPQCLFTL